MSPCKRTVEEKESLRMTRRLATFVSLLVAVGILAALFSASASARSPWWHVDTGSRPTNLWKPADELQELQAAPAPSLTVVKVGGSEVACMESPLCPLLTGGLPTLETAAQLQTALEVPAAYGPGGVTVTESPAAGLRFLVESTGPMAGRWVPSLETELGGSADVLTDGGSGRLVLTITNVGDAPVDGVANPVTVTDKLPAGVDAYRAEFYAEFDPSAQPTPCTTTLNEVSCTVAHAVSQFEAIEVEIFASLTGDPHSAGAPGSVAVSGGGAPSVSAPQSLVVSPERTPFGLESFSMRSEEEGGVPASQAGSHPFQLTQSLQFNAGKMPPGRRGNPIEQAGQPRNVRVKLPPGLVGNPSGVPTCSFTRFVTKPPSSPAPINECPAETAVGVASVTIVEPGPVKFARLAVPVFNLRPALGEPARLGFDPIGTPVTINTALLNEEAYAIGVSVNNTSQTAQILAATVTIWGNPGDPRHDESRGWGCVFFSFPSSACSRPPDLPEEAFLRQPISCSSPLMFDIEAEPWNVPPLSVIARRSDESSAPLACNKLPFDPSISVAPSSKVATSPSGLNFQLNLANAGLEDPEGISEAEPKKIEVVLPEGMVANPAQANGLAVCSPEQFKAEKVDSKPGEGCPEAAKIASVFSTTPLIKEPIEGSLYVATPHDNPFDSLIALYLVARAPSRGVLVKQAGEVRLDPITGQLRTTFDQLPQLPYSSFKVSFREGPRAPLVTPSRCGDYKTVANFVPWSAADPDNPGPGDILPTSSPFSVTAGPGGSACPSSDPFSPGFTAGTQSNAAGHYSPLDVRVTRNDGEGAIRSVSLKLPAGLTARLAGVDECSEAGIAQSRSREHDGGGAAEQASPSCPAGSQIGRTTVGSGVGSMPVYVPGKLYLAGPYEGAPLSVVAITPAVVGPFDVGTVVVREALHVDPRTAEVTVQAGPDRLPRIIDGIPVQLRDIRIETDRPEFTLNPTSCEPMRVDGTIGGEGATASVGSRYQAASCASLGFKPKLKLKLNGATRRIGHPALRAVLTAKPGEANIARAQVNLPHGEFLDQGNLNKTCTRPVLLAGNCPKSSVYGKAKAWTPLLDKPLQGPVYLVGGFGYKLPALVAELDGQIRVLLVGKVDSGKNKGIRNTFEVVPDAPVSRFVLEMKGGKKYGLLENSENLCKAKKAKRRAIVRFTGQNGKVDAYKPVVQNDCGKKKHRKKAGHQKSRSRR
jgi:hypothetical protein